MQHILLFIFIASITIASPGPGVLLTIINTMTYSFKYSFWGILGIAAGIGCIGLIVTLGLGAVITTSQTLLYSIKIIGAIYLLYLGIKQFFSAPKELLHDSNTTFNFSNKIKLFNKGLFVTLLNPKAIIFFMALFPQFIDVNKPIFMQFIYLTGIFCCLVICIHSMYAFFVQFISKKAGNSTCFGFINKIGGCCFILFAVILLISVFKV